MNNAEVISKQTCIDLGNLLANRRRRGMSMTECPFQIRSSAVSGHDPRPTFTMLLDHLIEVASRLDCGISELLTHPVEDAEALPDRIQVINTTNLLTPIHLEDAADVILCSDGTLRILSPEQKARFAASRSLTPSLN